MILDTDASHPDEQGEPWQRLIENGEAHQPNFASDNCRSMFLGAAREMRGHVTRNEKVVVKHM